MMTIRHSLVTITLVVIACTAVHLTGSSAVLEFTTSRSGLATVPTILTCHLTHWTDRHLAWDLGAFALLIVLLQRCGVRARAVSIAVLASAVAIPLSVDAFTSLSSYRGLSGIDSALFTLLGIHLLTAASRERDHLSTMIAVVALAGFTGKIAAEMAGAGPLFAEDLGGAAPVPVAHLAGAITGLAAAALFSTGSGREGVHPGKPGREAATASPAP